MTRAQFRAQLMSATADTWIESFMEALVRLMMEFKVHDPNIFLAMPAPTFDFMSETYVKVMKKDRQNVKDNQPPKKKTKGFGR